MRPKNPTHLKTAEYSIRHMKRISLELLHYKGLSSRNTGSMASLKTHIKTQTVTMQYMNMPLTERDCNS